MNINREFEEVMFKLSRSMRENMACSFVTHLSILQLHALTFLKKHTETQMSDIAAYFFIEKPTATSLLNKLVNLKLAKRKSDKNDRRIVHIVLTEKGEQVLAEATEHRNKKMSLMLSYLSSEDKKQMLRILRQIVANIEEQYEK